MAGKKQSRAGEAVVYKAPLSEIFVAMSGVTSAGIGGVQLEGVAGDMAGFSYDLRTALYQASPSRKAEIYEGVAQKALAKLKSVQPKLLDHANVVLMDPPKGKVGSKGTTQKRGGTALDVSAHIDSILERETVKGAVRAEEKLNVSGVFPQPFKADYMPEHYKSKKAAKQVKDAAPETPFASSKSPQPAFV